MNPTKNSIDFIAKLYLAFAKEKGKTDQKYWNREIQVNKKMKVRYLSNDLFASGRIFFVLEKREFFFHNNSINYICIL